jgi:hypothetical protein
MGREVKRVKLDFDWPIRKVWPGYMGQICTEQIEYCMGRIPAKTHDEICDTCRYVARLAQIEIKSYGCPNWKFDPPIGEGWQMWETTSEGSPLSPVFKTPEELAKWLADTGASAFGSQVATYESWFGMIQGSGWSPSAVIDENNGDIQDGVSFMARQKGRTHDQPSGE